MKCPHCDTTLLMTDRRGVEIDYCGECRGVWLDKGELDKLMEIAANEAGPATAPTPAPNRPSEYDRSDYKKQRYDSDRDRYHHKNHPRKKKTLMSEIFDIF